MSFSCWNPEDITVVVRSVGERTLECCLATIVRLGVTRDQVEVVADMPFYRAQVRSCEIAVESGRPWSIFVDADIVLSKDGLPSAFQSVFDRDPGRLLGFQPFTFDKFRMGCNIGGPHVYQTRFLGDAAQFVPGEESNRPESSMLKRTIEALDLEYLLLDVPGGVHGYEQTFADIFRTHFHKGNKHNQQFVTDHLKYFSERFDDPDMVVAFLGLSAGRASLFAGRPLDEMSGLVGSMFSEKAPIGDVESMIAKLDGIRSDDVPELTVLDRSSLRQVSGIATKMFGWLRK